MLYRPTNRGFTLIELMIALVIGLVTLSAALSFATSTYRTFTGSKVREEVYRNSRYIGMSLERDFQGTGVAIGRTPSFGTLAAWGDTILILQVPFEPNEAPPYDLDPTAGAATDPMPPGGTCGATCVDLLKDGSGNFEITAGNLARLQVAGERRLILVQSVTDNGTTSSLWFTSIPYIMHYNAGLSAGLILDRNSTFVQKLHPIIYYRDGTQLYRAQSFNLDGTPDGHLISEGVQSFEVKVVFVDGDEADEANSADMDDTNDYDDVVGIRIWATIAADKVNQHVKQGQLFTRNYEWRFAPRNLMYELNR